MKAGQSKDSIDASNGYMFYWSGQKHNGLCANILNYALRQHTKCGKLCIIYKASESSIDVESVINFQITYILAYNFWTSRVSPL